MDNGASLDLKTADEVAEAMKKWAMKLGVTHCTHWFQPLTEGTAEKHDAFVEHDGKGGMIEEFLGKQLVQQETESSSFPNGGIRFTFEARGYSAWDHASPVFVIGDTLMIPTVFISYTGESLDYKAPLKKAIYAVSKAATDVCHYFDPNVKNVIVNLGWEQEYFLVDETLCHNTGLAYDRTHPAGTRLRQNRKWTTTILVRFPDVLQPLWPTWKFSTRIGYPVQNAPQ